MIDDNIEKDEDGNPLDTSLNLNLTFGYANFSYSTPCTQSFALSYELLMEDDSLVSASPLWNKSLTYNTAT